MALQKSRKTKKLKHRPIGYWPSHHRFREMVDFCVRGKTNPVLQSCSMGDHPAQLCDFLYYDLDRCLWHRTALKEGKAVREKLSILRNRVNQFKCLNAADTIWAIAVEATSEILNLYFDNREIFDKLAPLHKSLPILATIHPDTSKVMAGMVANARLGTKTDDAFRIGSKTWFISDAPASVYARAIVTSVHMNTNLDPISRQQASWVKFDDEHQVQTIVLPFPKYIAGMDQLPIPITPASVIQYWRKGKEIILEEMPEFHLRPEWEKYRERRNYKDGAKKGVIQHAIFKDILIALKTIAGANNRRAPSKAVTK